MSRVFITYAAAAHSAAPNVFGSDFCLVVLSFSIVDR
jgi:hypothetical protein